MVLLEKASATSLIAEILKGNPQIFGSSPSPHLRPFLYFGVMLGWAMPKVSHIPILKSVASAIAKILQGNPKFWGAPLAQGYTHFFISV